jgi:hypothetical protein
MGNINSARVVEVFFKENITCVASQDIADKFLTLNEDERTKMVNGLIQAQGNFGFCIENGSMSCYVSTNVEGKWVSVNYSSKIEFEK